MQSPRDLKQAPSSPTESPLEVNKPDAGRDLVQALIEARQRAGLTQTAVAARMGVLQGNISRLESGQFSPTMRTLQSYAQALGAQVVLSIKPFL
jgi:DNA-binding XRE family transcriptional regulator